MSLKFAIEPLEECWNQLVTMAAQHWNETMEWHRGHEDFAPSFARYNAYDKAGLLLAFTARDGGVMVGYALMYLTPSMHTQRTIATEDTVFLLPPYRRGRNGLRFYEFVEREVAKRGAIWAMVTAKPGSAAAKLLAHMGYTHINDQFAKHLSADSAPDSPGERCHVLAESATAP